MPKGNLAHKKSENRFKTWEKHEEKKSERKKFP